MPPTSLLDIAPELRLFIYREVFRRLTISFSVPVFLDSPLAQVQSNDPKEDHHLSILLTCRKLYEEARPLLLANANGQHHPASRIHADTRIIISTKSISDYLRARNFFFQDMADLLKHKAEIQIEFTSTRLFATKVSATALKHGLQVRIHRISSKYSDSDLVRDCIAAIYPVDSSEDVANRVALRNDTQNEAAKPVRALAGDESEFRGVYLLCRPSRQYRRNALFKGEEIKYTERKFRYNRDTDAFEWKYAPGQSLSVPVHR